MHHARRRHVRLLSWALAACCCAVAAPVASAQDPVAAAAEVEDNARAWWRDRSAGRMWRRDAPHQRGVERAFWSRYPALAQANEEAWQAAMVESLRHIAGVLGHPHDTVAPVREARLLRILVHRDAVTVDATVQYEDAPATPGTGRLALSARSAVARSVWVRLSGAWRLARHAPRPGAPADATTGPAEGDTVRRPADEGPQSAMAVALAVEASHRLRHDESLTTAQRQEAELRLVRGREVADWGWVVDTTRQLDGLYMTEVDAGYLRMRVWTDDDPGVPRGQVVYVAGRVYAGEGPATAYVRDGDARGAALVWTVDLYRSATLTPAD